MKKSLPKQTNAEIVKQLQTNKSRQYTEAAHAEIMNRLIKAIGKFNESTARTDRKVLILTATIVCLTFLNVLLTIVNLRHG